MHYLAGFYLDLTCYAKEDSIIDVACGRGEMCNARNSRCKGNDSERSVNHDERKLSTTSNLFLLLVESVQ